jgi:HD-GYP domain-containing protein (c-di-GMP phosphodiesterase class II)
VSRFSLAGPQKEGVHIPQSIIDMCRGDYQAVLDQSQGFFAKDFKEQSELAMAKNLLKQLTESLMRNQTLLLFFSSIKEHDECTFVHSVNASILAMVQAQSLHLEPEMLFQIGLAGFLHDAGKLEVSEDILRKPGVLDKDEFDEVMLHPQTGARYLVMHREFGELAVVVAFEHHIKFDLNGYPVLPRKRSPHFVSQIITIADVYDSLRTNRHYRKDYPPEKVYQLMQGESGKFYDPVLLQNFFRIVGVWPPGSVVQLSNGEIALVREVNPHRIDLPIVQIIYDVAGNKVTEMVILDLAKRLLEREQEQLKIVKSIYVNEEEKKKYIPAHLLGSS